MKKIRYRAEVVSGGFDPDEDRTYRVVRGRWPFQMEALIDCRGPSLNRVEYWSGTEERVPVGTIPNTLLGEAFKEAVMNRNWTPVPGLIRRIVGRLLRRRLMRKLLTE